MLNLRTFLQTVYSLSFPVMLVKIALPQNSSLRVKKAKGEWKLAEKLGTSSPS